MRPGRQPPRTPPPASGPSDQRSAFTNRASTVDISAPGESILSSCLGGGYCMMDGTSMAAPIVSGAAALVFASGVTAPGAVSWRLRSTAASRQGVVSGKRLDIAAALAAAPTRIAPTISPSPRPTLRPTATSAVRIIPIAVPPGCRVVIMCDQP